MTTIVAMSSYFKGNPFLQELKRLGVHVILVTVEELKDEPWARDAVDEFFYLQLPGLGKQPDITYAMTWLARDHEIDRIVPLDDFDVETAADLREHFRMKGQTASEARFYRDKLAMRVKAQQSGINIPPFVSTINNDELNHFLDTVPAPWVLKPRGEASAMGIKKVQNKDELWRHVNDLGDRRSWFLVEQFLPGDVYHVDSVVWDSEVVFVSCCKYGMPPMSVYQGGGVFATSTVPYGSPEETELLAINKETAAAMGLRRGVIHAEFIHAHADGKYYFLENAARVGGASIDQMIEQATGVNLWAEWAKIEVAQARGEEYHPPAQRKEYAGLLVSLARQDHPDTSAYNDPELVWRMDKKQHVGMILRSTEHARIQELLTSYAQRIAQDFTTSAPPLDHAPH